MSIGPTIRGVAHRVVDQVGHHLLRRTGSTEAWSRWGGTWSRNSNVLLRLRKPIDQLRIRPTRSVSLAGELQARTRRASRRRESVRPGASGAWYGPRSDGPTDGPRRCPAHALLQLERQQLRVALDGGQRCLQPRGPRCSGNCRAARLPAWRLVQTGVLDGQRDTGGKIIGKSSVAVAKQRRVDPEAPEREDTDHRRARQHRHRQRVRQRAGLQKDGIELVPRRIARRVMRGALNDAVQARSARPPSVWSTTSGQRPHRRRLGDELDHTGGIGRDGRDLCNARSIGR